MLMKELKIPWNNWSSFERETPASVFPPGDARAGHPWFTGKLATQDGLDDLILRCPPALGPVPGLSAIPAWGAPEVGRLTAIDESV